MVLTLRLRFAGTGPWSRVRAATMATSMPVMDVQPCASANSAVTQCFSPRWGSSVMMATSPYALNEAMCRVPVAGGTLSVFGHREAQDGKQEVTGQRRFGPTAQALESDPGV